MYTQEILSSVVDRRVIVNAERPADDRRDLYPRLERTALPREECKLRSLTRAER